MELYEPREDSKLLAEQVKEHAFGNCLDMGTGEGIQALEASKSIKVKKVLAADIQKEIVEHCKKNIRHKKIAFRQSDLFSKIKGKFDTIIFNPPYLPEDARVRDITIDGGKKGYEILERFFSEANAFLKTDGIILITFSSLTKKDKVDGMIAKNLLEKEELGRQMVFFECLYVYIIRKSGLLKKIEKEGITSIKFFTEGHRGMLFSGNYGNKEVMVKTKLPKSEAVGRIENEGMWLKILNKHNIGPRMLISKKDYIIYEFIPGEFIVKWAQKSKKADIIKILKGVFMQMFILDKLKVNKEEMHHPPKHIVITKKQTPVLLDFERCHPSARPKNVTQFCQFLISSHFSDILREKGINIDENEMMRNAGEYKGDMCEEKLKMIIECFGR